MSVVAPPLNAFGVPILTLPAQASSSTQAQYDTHTPINLLRLLNRLEAQLDSTENGVTDGSSDSWQAAGMAIALTHANSALNALQQQQGLSSEVTDMRSRLQRATQRYVNQFPLQRIHTDAAKPKDAGQGSFVAETFDTRQFLVRGVMDDDESDSEFEDQPDESAPKVADRLLGGLAPESEKGGEVDADFDEYESAASLRRRKGTSASAKETREEEAAKEGDAPPTALQSERSVQDSLSAELLRMAGVLKSNSLKFADALERDRKILEEADEKLQGNLTLMTRTRGKLGDYSRKARSMGWMTLGAVAMVCMSWVIMFVLIRLT